MNIAEIQVYSTDGITNIAAGKPVGASSTWGTHPATNLTDGSLDTIAHSSCVDAAKFTIDLGKVYPITQIVVYNRRDCCTERIAGAMVTISDESQNNVYISNPFQLTSSGLGYIIYTVFPPDTQVTPALDPQKPPAPNVPAPSQRPAAPAPSPREYIGCYADAASTKTMPVDLGPVKDVQACLSAARKGKYPYAALQNGVCYASSQPTFHVGGKVNDGDCMYACAGGAVQYAVECGTAQRNAVYATGIALPSVSVRYAVLTRTDGSAEYINVYAMQAYDDIGQPLVDGVIPTLYPQLSHASDFGPQFAFIDAVRPVYTNMCHTEADPKAFIQLDFQRDTKVSMLQIVNRLDCCKNRIVGTTLYLQDSNKRTIFTYPITSEQDVYVINTYNPSVPQPQPAPAPTPANVQSVLAPVLAPASTFTTYWWNLWSAPQDVQLKYIGDHYSTYKTSCSISPSACLTSAQNIWSKNFDALTRADKYQWIP
jgi:hypothetical protein